MFIKSTRIIILINCLMLGLISITLWIHYQPETLGLTKHFFTNSAGCKDIEGTCFMGIVPNESEQDTVYDRLYDYPFLHDFRMTQVEFGVRQMYWQWNGQQPNFIEEGNISLIGNRAVSLEITTTLMLGEILLAFGETDSVIVTTFSIVLYYPELGIFVRTTPQCDVPWYSPVAIEIRERPINLSLATSLDNAITAYCHNR